MKLRTPLVALLISLSLSALPGGCIPAFQTVLLNQTKERTGDITFVFQNATPYRAIFSYGTWDAWDRTPGAINLQQLRLDAYTTSDPATVPCARNAAVGTVGLIQRAVDTDADQALADFDADAFDTVVRFSSAPEDSESAGLPTEGTAEGVEKLLGVEFSCLDQLIFTFVEDPDAPGGFRIDYTVILDVEKNQ